MWIGAATTGAGVQMAEIVNVSQADLDAAKHRVRTARSVVVKVGSNVLVGGTSGVLNRRVFCGLVEQIANLLELPGRSVVLVTSGAVAAGRRMTGRQGARPESLAEKQALAAIGQPALMHMYAEEFRHFGRTIAQILVTREDLGDRDRFLNVRNTVRQLTELGSVVPIVNENDTVANDEIRFGDNDHLGALFTTVVGADLLIILSDVKAVYEADPNKDPAARPLSAIYADDPLLAAIAGPTASDGFGTGGMASKVRAGRKAAAFGVPTIIAPGREHDVLGRILAGESVGTMLVPHESRLNARKAWILFGSKAGGSIRVDRGAEVAIRSQGRSLLPSGVRSVVGEFPAGAPVGITNEDGVEIARGLAAYSAAELRAIAGHRSEEIATLLGFHNGDAAVHRDDLVPADEIEAVGS
jgi:glutamate 5-kinase